MIMFLKISFHLNANKSWLHIPCIFYKLSFSKLDVCITFNEQVTILGTTVKEMSLGSCFKDKTVREGHTCFLADFAIV